EAIDDSDKRTNKVLIQNTLAETNDLAVGDTFTITSTEDEDTTYEMTIKGIYESSETSGSMGMKFNFMNPSNSLYTSYTFENELNCKSDDNTIDSA
ncbi:ABC transporter permease, partial [Enterococcus faecium]